MNRETLPKRIKSIAAKDTHAALQLARRGRQYESLLDGLLDAYYRAAKEHKRLQSALTPQPEYRRRVETTFDLAHHELQSRFFAAIDTRDSGAIKEIASAIARVRKDKGKGDHFRANILHFKLVLEAKGQQWPIGKLAVEIGWPLNERHVGFPQLRRLCKQLNFPLRISRQLRAA